MNKGMTDKVSPFGVVERRLYSRDLLAENLKKEGINFDIDLEKYTFQSLYFSALKAGLRKDILDRLVDKSAKKQFKDNFVWKFIKKHFDKDVVIPFVTGYYTTAAIKNNLVTTIGHQQVAKQIGGTTATPMTAIAIGTGTTAAAIADTALQTEITTGGGARGAATVTNTGNTEQWVKTFTFTATFAVTEEGILDNNASAGNLLAHQVFSAVNVVSGDSLQITHQLTC